MIVTCLLVESADLEEVWLEADLLNNELYRWRKTAFCVARGLTQSRLILVVDRRHDAIANRVNVNQLFFPRAMVMFINVVLQAVEGSSK